MAYKNRRDRRNFTADRERPPLLDREPDPPFVVVHRLLRSAKRDQANAVNAVRDQARQQVREQRDRYVELAGEVATTLHELRGLLDHHGAALREAGLDPASEALAALHRRLGKVLHSTGARLVDPVGEPYPAVADHTDVKGRPGDTDDSALVVAQTISPGLLLADGELIRLAEVFLEPAAVPEESRDSAQKAAEEQAAPQAREETAQEVREEAQEQAEEEQEEEQDAEEHAAGSTPAAEPTADEGDQSP